MFRDEYEAVIGLEVHAQLQTKSKIFCSCSAEFGAEPNENSCPICLGHPGVLPVLNKTVVEFAVMMGIAVECEINRTSILARKNYFYPDLPKGYQISQYDKPICEHGVMRVLDSNSEIKEIGIARIHIEEDAGKSIHDQGSETLIDVNRCGVPLIEIVSEPEISTAQEAYQYLTGIKQIVQYLEICDGNMEEGSLRCDANVSVRKKGTRELGTKTEIKNLNSFRNVEKAIEFEINRQLDLIEDGHTIIQQTLLWNADTGVAHPMRSKEEAHDYRYFPDPDLLPVVISDEWFDIIQSQVIELPKQKLERYIADYGLPRYDAEVLTQTKQVAEYFEATCKLCAEFKQVSNWVMTEVLKVVNEQKITIDKFAVTPDYLAELIQLISKGTISGKIAKEVFQEIVQTGKAPEQIIKEKNLLQISDEGAISQLISSVIVKFPEQKQQFIDGEEKVLGFFVGQVMKESKGKANPALVNKLLKELLIK